MVAADGLAHRHLILPDSRCDSRHSLFLLGKASHEQDLETAFDEFETLDSVQRSIGLGVLHRLHLVGGIRGESYSVVVSARRPLIA